jgi:hypothetical protein
MPVVRKIVKTGLCVAAVLAILACLSAVNRQAPEEPFRPMQEVKGFWTNLKADVASLRQRARNARAPERTAEKVDAQEKSVAEAPAPTATPLTNSQPPAPPAPAPTAVAGPMAEVAVTNAPENDLGFSDLVGMVRVSRRLVVCGRQADVPTNSTDFAALVRQVRASREAVTAR